jgi:predicted permease
MDGRLLLFVSAATAVTAVLAGLLPALQASRTSPGDVLHHSARGNTDTRSSLRNALMVAQVALSVVLLIGAGLFVKSLSQAAEADLGFDHNRIVVVQIEGIPDIERDRRDQLYRAALSRINGLPGVHTAVLASETIPLWGYNEQHEMRVRGMDSIPRVPGGGPYTYSGTEGFVEALGLEIVRGRSFTSGEYRTGAELVVMVSESFVRTIWPGQDPMVECVILEHGAVERDGPEPCRSVVGVYKDIAVRSLADAGGLSVTWPTPPESTRLGGIIVRAGGDPLNLVRSIREQVHAISADVRFVRVNLISDRVDGLLGPWKLGATMFTAFGVLALVVAAVGLYSVLSFGVAQRQRELGIRAALGATRQDLIRMIMGQAARFVSMGLALGAAIALATGRFIDSLLFGVEASDPSVYGLVIITLFVAGAVAALVPAWRATSVNPTTAIQAE